MLRQVGGSVEKDAGAVVGADPGAGGELVHSVQPAAAAALAMRFSWESPGGRQQQYGMRQQQYGMRQLQRP